MDFWMLRAGVAVGVMGQLMLNCCRKYNDASAT
jgi:hypothetical protein